MSRPKLDQSLLNALKTVLGPDRTDGEKWLRDAVLRIAESALKGGVDRDEVWTVLFFAITRPMLTDQIERDRSLVDARRKSLEALRRVNAGLEVDPSERERLMRLSHELEAEFPKAAPRYREIARRFSTQKMEYKESRIRYLIEGSRKSKKKA